MSCYPKINSGTGNCPSSDCDKIGSGYISYIGPNLACTGINTNDTLSVALQKIDAAICEIAAQLEQCCLTTTSTTTIYNVDCTNPIVTFLVAATTDTTTTRPPGNCTNPFSSVFE